MSDQEKQFIKGFNNGYLLARYEPELSDIIVKTHNEHSEYLQGLVSGKQEFDKEKDHNLQKGSSHDNALEKDKDNRERER